jgi:hypothetical protein
MHPTFEKGFSGKTVFKQIPSLQFTTPLARKMFSQFSKSDKEFLEFKMHRNLQFGKMWKKVHLKLK